MANNVSLIAVELFAWASMIGAVVYSVYSFKTCLDAQR